MAPFKSSDGRNIGKLVRSFGTSFIGNTIPGGSGGPSPIVASGGFQYTPGNGFIYHAFIASNNSSPNNIFNQGSGSDTIDVLIVAGGGGGGGGYYAGGGGAGGILEGSIENHQPGAIVITVGAGGAGGVSASGQATNGSNSSFGSIIALGGGRGGTGPGTNDGGGDGGSGGGSSYYNFPGIGAALPQPAPVDFNSYGNDGAASRNPGVVGAGGGGAGAAGSGMGGGDGQAFPKFPASDIPLMAPLAPLMGPNNNVYGGGGAGAPGGGGGVGGGGNAISGNGVDYLGGGGGASASPSNPGTGRNGGDGIVIIRYAASS